VQSIRPKTCGHGATSVRLSVAIRFACGSQIQRLPWRPAYAIDAAGNDIVAVVQVARLVVRQKLEAHVAILERLTLKHTWLEPPPCHAVPKDQNDSN